MYGALTYTICMYVNMSIIKHKDLRNGVNHLIYPTKMCFGPKIEISYFLVFPLYFSEFPLYILGAMGYGCVIDRYKSC